MPLLKDVASFSKYSRSVLSHKLLRINPISSSMFRYSEFIACYVLISFQALNQR